jgi:hypothetical protein
VRNIGQKSAARIQDALGRVWIVDQEATRSEEQTEQQIRAAQGAVEIPVVPAEITGWQADHIERQICAGLLHDQAKTGHRSISEWLVIVKGLDRREAFETMTGIIGSSFNVCDELEFLLDSIERDDEVAVLLSRYGYQAQTLEETGAQIGVTRERVRQLGQKLERHIGRQVKLALEKQPRELANMPSLLRMQSALLVARDLGSEMTYADWKRRIVSSGLVGSWTSRRYRTIDPVEAMIAVCNLLADLRLNGLTIPTNLGYAIKLAAAGSPETRAKIARIRRTLPRRIAKVIARHTKFCGAVHTRWLSQEIDKSLPQTADILRALEYERVFDHWFVPRVGDNDDEVTRPDVLHRVLMEMFQYCGRLSTDDICCGLRLAVSRARFPVPPPEVMEEILALYGYQHEDGLWYCDEQMDQRLSRGERVIKQCIEQHGPVVHHSELAQAFVDSELSFPSLHATLRRSPIFDRIDRGLYKLRGQPVSRQDIERAESCSERVSVDPRVEYDKRGNITVTANLSVIAVGTGVLASEQFPNLSGEWDCFVKHQSFGKLQANGSEFRGLRESFEHLGCQAEGRVKLVFDVWSRTVEVEKVQD